MKKFLVATLAMLSINFVCFGMDKTSEEITIKHSDTIESLQFSPDEQYIFFTTNNGGLRQKIEFYTSEGEYIKTIKTDERDFPKFNKQNPSQFTIATYKNDMYTCYFYDLQNDTKKKLMTHSNGIIARFVASGEKIIVYDLSNTKKCILYNIEKDSTKKISFSNSIDQINTQTDNNCILFTVENEGAYRYNIEEDTLKKITDQKISIDGFTDNPKNFMITDYKNLTLKVYAINNPKKSITTKKLNNSSEQPLFLTNSIIFLQNLKNDSLRLLNLKTNSINEIEKPSRPNPTKKFIYFSSENGSSVYSMKQEKFVKTFTKKTEEVPYFHFNTDESYCVIGCNNTAKIYETKKWEKIDTITFKVDEERRPWIELSPCGKFIVLIHRASDCLKFYDIENRKTILKHYWPSKIAIIENIKFHPNNKIIFRATDKKIILYDYKNDKKTEYTTKKPITCFAITDKLIALSTGKKTKLIPIKTL